MKVLAIDDSKLALSQVERCIKDIVPMAEVIKTQNPKDGIEIAKQQCGEIKFIIVDYNMDTMTGLDVVDEILPHYQTNQIAILTANTQISIKNLVEAKGIRFLRKDDLRNQLENIFKNLLTQD